MTNNKDSITMEEVDFFETYSYFNGLIIDLCKKCNGFCEKTQFPLFIPGEIEYISKIMNLPLEEFKKKFVTVVKYKNHSVNLMRIGRCPFLNEKFRCNLENFNSKPLICRFYPLWMGLKNNKPTLFNDTDLCPNAKKLPLKFKIQAKRIFKRIQNKIPGWFLEFETQYDDSLFNQSKLELIKNKELISLHELEQCKLENQSDILKNLKNGKKS